MEQYRCKECGCEEFITQPTMYNIFENRNGKLTLVGTEFTDDLLVLFCRECSELLEFDDENVVV